MNSELVRLNIRHKLCDDRRQLARPFPAPSQSGGAVFEFFTANVRNKHPAGLQAAGRFSDWCAGRGLSDLTQVKPRHIADIEGLQSEVSKLTVKEHLAALRVPFDWLVVGHVLDVNPAHAVRGPRPRRARALLAVIDAGTLNGLRDRALIAPIIYTFARVGAVLQMNVGDYFTQGRRGLGAPP